MSQMHLLAFVVHTPVNHIMTSWADPRDTRLKGMASFDHWIDMAKTLERGCFDGAFFADIPAAYDMYHQSTDETVRYGVAWPTHDPVALLGAMAAATERVGLASTASVSGAQPYSLVRTLSTLDYLSGGRIGWNVVTGHARSEHRALGREQTEHDERYDRADEFMDICRALWDGIPPDAIVADRENRILADPSKIKKVKYHGKYYSCEAVPPVLPSPQGRPVIFQAGSSGRGLQFALRNADAIFSQGADLPGMKRAVENVRNGERAAGMSQQKPVLLAMQFFLGSTEEEAIRHRDELLASIPIEAVLARVSGSLGVDFGELDLDKPLAESKTQASQGLMALASKMLTDSNLSIRDAIRKSGWVGAMPPLVGGPEQIADQLENIWRETGCTGFNLSPPLSPTSLDDFVDHVVPILQKRGIYRYEYKGRTFREHLFETAGT